MVHLADESDEERLVTEDLGHDSVEKKLGFSLESQVVSQFRVVEKKGEIELLPWATTSIM